MPGCGRTKRTRRRRWHGPQNVNWSSDETDPKIIKLIRWLMQHGFDKRSCHVKVHTFNETGRGLMALKTFKPGDILLSVPESLLITTSTVLSSYLAPVIRSFPRSRLSPVEAICSFLICELHRGQQSPWFDYIDVLPQSYSLPVYWDEEECLHLPNSVYAKAKEQQNLLLTSFHKLMNFFSHVESELPYLHGAFDYEKFRWAWSSVNTRCVYMERPSQPEFNGEPDRCALVPFLDFFNHSPNAQMKAMFDAKDRTYKIQTMSQVSKYSEAFINYGPHDNAKLILEYGFSVPCNPHDCVEFTVDDLLAVCSTLSPDTDVPIRTSFLDKFQLSSGLSCSADGLSWNLMAAIRVLTAASIDKECLMNVYLNEETVVGKDRKSSALLRALLCNFLLTIPSVTELHVKATYHQKLASDLSCCYRTLLNCSLSNLS